MNARAITGAEPDNLAAASKSSPHPSAAQPGPKGTAEAGSAERGPPSPGMRQHLEYLRPVLLPLGFGVGVLALWEFIVWATDYPPAILPGPMAVVATLIERRYLLLANIPPTAGVALGGFLIAVLIGTALAVLMTWSRYAKEAFYPNIVAFQIVPKVAWAPMFILWLGIDTESRLGFATFISVFPIIISMTTGLGNTDSSLLRLCRALTASQWQIMVYVRLPYALPYLFSAMKISITLAMIGVIVGEFMTSQRGLGFVILTAAGRAEADLMIAAVLVLCLIGLGFYALVAFGTWLVDRWFGR